MSIVRQQTRAADQERALNDVIDFTWFFGQKEITVAAAAAL